MKYHLLLAHGGDARHMPWNPGRMAQAGFDYIACGHIHKPGILIPDKMAYAGALEPTDETQLGPHGYIRGTVDEHGTRIQFVPFARYEYEDLVLNVTEDLTQYALETKPKNHPPETCGIPCRRAGIFSETAAGLRQSHLRGG